MENEIHTFRHFPSTDDCGILNDTLLETELLYLSFVLLLCKLHEFAVSKNLTLKRIAASSKDNCEFLEHFSEDNIKNYILHLWWQLHKLRRINNKPEIIFELVGKERSDTSLNVVII
jgi:hypothetical protein